MLLFFSAFMYYYIEDGLYEGCIPLVLLIGFELLLELFTLNSEGITSGIKTGFLFLIMIYIFSILCKIVIMHPYIFVGFLISMFLFLMILYRDNSNNTEEDNKDIMDE